MEKEEGEVEIKVKVMNSPDLQLRIGKRIEIKNLKGLIAEVIE